MKQILSVITLVVTIMFSSFMLFATKDNVNSLHKDIREIRYDVKLLLRSCVGGE